MKFRTVVKRTALVAAIGIGLTNAANAATINFIATTASPDFNTGTNWTGGVSPGSSDVANMSNQNITAAQAINVSSSVTIQGLSIGDNSTGSGSVFPITLSATAGQSITFNNASGDATITKPNRTNGVNDTITAPINIATGEKLVVTNGIQTLNLNGPITGDSTTIVEFANTSAAYSVGGDLSGFNGTLRTTTGNATVNGSNFNIALHVINGQNATFNILSAGPGGGTDLAQAPSRYFRFGTDNPTVGGGSLLKMGALSGNGWINPQTGSAGAGGAYAFTNYEVGNANIDTVFGGTIIRRATSEFKKVGTASLTLSGPNYYDGTTVVSSGTLIAGANVSASTLVQTAAAMPAGQDITVTGHGLSVGDRVTFGGTVGTGMTATSNYVVHTVVDANTIKIAYATSPATVITTTTAASSLTVSQQSAFGSGNIAVQVGDANTGANNVALLTGGAFEIKRAVNITSDGTGTATFGGNTNHNSAFSGAISLAKNVNLTSVAAGTNSVLISGVISGSGFGINKVGAGNATLASINTYSGNTTVSDGVLITSSTGRIVNNGSAHVFMAAPDDTALGNPVFARATASLVNADNYAGLGSQSIAGGGALGTAADLLAGIDSTGTDAFVGMQWRQRTTGDIAASLISDVLNLGGMVNTANPNDGFLGLLTHGETDMFVLQMSYDPSSFAGDADEAFQASSGFLIPVWNNTGVWENSVLGNFGAGNNVPAFQGDAAWTADTTLGHWGIDTANNKVWAVLNHNSEFAVVPEPNTFLLAGVGLAGLAMLRKRRAK